MMAGEMHESAVMNDRPSIIVIGGSAGAIDALLRLVPQIPASLPA
jgi:chemotaxis response regulator CheB